MTMIDPKTLGRRIRFFRQRAGISQLDLETSVDASSGFISRIETGQVNPTKETILKISKVLDLRILELDYLTGLIAEPASDDEIEKAKLEVKDLFNKDGMIAFMLDERTRFIDVSRDFLKLFNLPVMVKDLLYKQSIIRIGFSKDSNTPFQKMLDPQHYEEVARNALTRFYVQSGFMSDDETVKDALNVIENDPMLYSIWQELQKTNGKLVAHTSAYREVQFIINGGKVNCLYSAERVQKYPRFELTEYALIPPK